VQSVVAGDLCVIILGALVALAAGADYKERKWTSANGSFSISATMVEVDGSMVVLKKGDGSTVRVPIDKLSSADHVYVQSQTSSPSADGGAKADAVTTAAGVEAEAEKMTTAKQAVLIYQFHLSSDVLTGSERRAAEKRRDHWKDLAEKDYERLGEKWMTPEEAEALREKAQDKINYGYEMLRLGNGELSEKALREASKLAPDNVQAEFLMGLVYSVVVDDDKKAIRHFQECLERDPTNVGALNNLAICQYYQRNYNGAVASWLKAVEISPETPALGQKTSAA
jgi:tetratricopeptide (TPR) repeat protein